MGAIGYEEVTKLSLVKIAIFFPWAYSETDRSYQHKVLASVALSHRVVGKFVWAEDS